MADVFVVFENGNVAEQGSEELMHAGATYSELYTLKARQYE